MVLSLLSSIGSFTIIINAKCNILNWSGESNVNYSSYNWKKN